MKLSVGHNDGYLMLLCLIDGGLQAFQGGVLNAAIAYCFSSAIFNTWFKVANIFLPPNSFFFKFLNRLISKDKTP